jgi:hypothetical protein
MAWGINMARPKRMRLSETGFRLRPAAILKMDLPQIIEGRRIVGVGFEMPLKGCRDIGKPAIAQCKAAVLK